MMVPRGKMLGGSSGINYMAYVRGHPGDFDAWATAVRPAGATTRCCPTSRRARASRRAATSSSTPTRTTRRAAGRVGARAGASPARASSSTPRSRPASRRGDYNGRDRGGPDGVVSLLQTTTRDGKRASTYHAFLEGEPSSAPNLDGHLPTRTSTGSCSRATPAGCGRRASSTAPLTATTGRPAAKEVVLSARRDRVAADPAALGHRADGTSSRRSVSTCVARRTRRRQAPQGPPAARAGLPGAGYRACR